MGKNGTAGNVRKEKLLVRPAQIERWARRFEMDLFTGRTRQEVAYTFERWRGTRHLRTVITMDDVRHKKPHPEGLRKILRRRDATTAVYVGDNVDDALAARAAGVAFLGIVAPAAFEAEKRRRRFRELGALGVLPGIGAIEEWLRRRR